MGLRGDLDRFREVGEERRQDLAEFIQYGDLGRSRQDRIRIPIKLVDLPEFVYDRHDVGGVGQGTGETPEPGDRIGRPGEEGDGGGEPGNKPGEHEFYEMDPDEFAEELDEELGLDLEPKGKRVREEEAGEYTDLTRAGPHSTLDLERLFREGIKRKLATDFDEGFASELLRVEGVDAGDAFRWLRARGVPIGRTWLEDAYEAMTPDERGRWSSIEAMTDAVEYEPTSHRIRREGLGRIPFRREDERYRFPEPRSEPAYDVVVVNIRDVSGSMRREKRELVERTFTPLDWYLQGKYDTAAFVYIVHDATAWEVEREEFFGIRSGGGTKISSAYELTREILEERYPWHAWNRYVFAAGDSENSSNDTADNVIPLMERIPANLHAYVETQPNGSAINATHAEEVERELGHRDDVAVAYVGAPDDVTDAIYRILSTEVEAA